MRGLTLMLIAVLGGAAGGLSQQYYESSGQTKPFSLAAGENAGWETGMAGKLSRAPHMNPSLTILTGCGRNEMRLRMSGLAQESHVVIFNVSGERLWARDAAGGAPTVSSVNLPNGLYFARLTVNGRSVQTTRFIVTR